MSPDINRFTAQKKSFKKSFRKAIYNRGLSKPELLEVRNMSRRPFFGMLNFSRTTQSCKMYNTEYARILCTKTEDELVSRKLTHTTKI